MKARRTYDPAPVLDIATGRGMNHKQLAREVNVTARTVSRWSAGNPLGAAVADRVAVALNLHPVLLWPDYCDAAA